MDFAHIAQVHTFRGNLRSDNDLHQTPLLIPFSSFHIYDALVVWTQLCIAGQKTVAGRCKGVIGARMLLLLQGAQGALAASLGLDAVAEQGCRTTNGGIAIRFQG